MPRPRPLPATLRGRAFTVADARERGVTRARLRSSDLVAPFHGVRSPFPVADIYSKASAYAQRMPPGFAFSHSTAALLHGLRMPEGFHESDVHVMSTGAARAPRGKGVVGHRTSAPVATVVLADGLRVVSPIDAWCQLAEVLTVDELVVVGDGLVRRKRPVASMAQLEAAVAERRGRRGFHRIEEAMRLIRPRTDSPRETLLRLVVVRAGFPEPVVNHPIVNRNGRVIAHGDLAFPEFMTLLEYDGAHHREDEVQFTIDVERHDEIMEERWRDIRVDKVLMRRRPALLRKIDRALRERGWSGP